MFYFSFENRVAVLQGPIFITAGQRSAVMKVMPFRTKLKDSTSK
jgi:hypothetical protein